MKTFSTSCGIGLFGVLFLAVGCSSDSGNGPGASSDAGTGGASNGSGGGTSAGGTAVGNHSGGGGASSSGGAASGSGGNPAAAAGGATASGGAVGAGMGGALGAGGAAAGGANAGSHTNPLSQTLIDAFVAAHNSARSGPLNPPPAPALPPVSWDATLADVAFNYLSKCNSTSGSLVDHNANRTTDYKALGGKDYVGENIYASTGGTVAPADAVSSWMSEASNYNYANGDFSQAGHYTQVVWRTSVRIGCAIVNCPSSKLKFHNTILCDYAPAGNNTTQKPY